MKAKIWSSNKKLRLTEAKEYCSTLQNHIPLPGKTEVIMNSFFKDSIS